MPRVDYAQEADNDLVGIAEFIARDKPEVARRWVQKIRDTCSTLATQPEMGELRKGFGVPEGLHAKSFGEQYFLKVLFVPCCGEPLVLDSDFFCFLFL